MAQYINVTSGEVYTVSVGQSDLSDEVFNGGTMLVSGTATYTSVEAGGNLYDEGGTVSNTLVSAGAAFFAYGGGRLRHRCL